MFRLKVFPWLGGGGFEQVALPSLEGLLSLEQLLLPRKYIKNLQVPAVTCPTHRTCCAQADALPPPPPHPPREMGCCQSSRQTRRAALALD